MMIKQYKSKNCKQVNIKLIIEFLIHNSAKVNNIFFVFYTLLDKKTVKYNVKFN